MVVLEKAQSWQFLLAVALAGGLLAGGCQRSPQEPRLVFYAGVEIWGARAGVAWADSTQILQPFLWKTGLLRFGDPNGLELEVHQTTPAEATGRGRVWVLRFVAANHAPDTTLLLRAVAPLLVREKEGGFLEFSTGEAVRIRCMTDARAPETEVLGPGESFSSHCDTLILFQPVSRVALVLASAADTTWSVEWTVRRQKRRKRQYDLVLRKRPVRPLALKPGQKVELPPVTVRVLTGRSFTLELLRSGREVRGAAEAVGS